MSGNKKFSAKEAAIAVLAKAEQMLKSSKLAKALPASEIHPKEQVQGEPAKPVARIEEQAAPQANPKEKIEGNNPEWGNEPGNYKLAKFCGHMSAKRKMKG